MKLGLFPQTIQVLLNTPIEIHNRSLRTTLLDFFPWAHDTDATNIILFLLDSSIQFQLKDSITICIGAYQSLIGNSVKIGDRPAAVNGDEIR